MVSQAHEAVNNALEKGLELCRSKGIEFNAVRLGSESAASDAIRHLHASSIEQSYRERFKAEQKERIVELASILGLPKAFASDFIDLHLRLGMLSDRITKLQQRTGAENEKALLSLDARVRALSETFLDIARDVYGFEEALAPAQVVASIQARLIEQYEVRSLDAIERLEKLIRLSAEWLRALGSPDANFAEFLAKSRTVVAGKRRGGKLLTSLAWLTPDYSLWGRGESFSETVSAFSNALVLDNSADSLCLLAYAEPGQEPEVVNRLRVSQLNELHFSRPLAPDGMLMAGRLELLLYPTGFMVALCHISTSGNAGLWVPIGVMSSLPKHLDIAHKLIRKAMSGKRYGQRARLSQKDSRLPQVLFEEGLSFLNYSGLTQNTNDDEVND